MEYNKKTILYLITQSELGGAQRYVFDLAKNLKNEFNIYVAFGEPGEQGELAKKLKTENIGYYVLPRLKRAISPINDFIAILEIVNLIKKIKPDIIHLNSSKISILGSLAICFNQLNPKSKILPAGRQVLNLKSIYTVHGWVFNEPLPEWQKLFYKYAEKFTARWKDRLICVSEYDRQIALKEKICTAEKLVAIHNGIEPVNFLLREEARQLLIKNYELRITNYVITSIGNLYKTKGYEYLIKAIKIIVTRYALRVTCVIIGDGPERDNLQKLIKENKLENNIFLSGRIDEAARLLPAFDLYVCSSVKEGLSYTLIEAMRAGLPIIATRVGGNPELIEDNKSGLLVNPQNVEELATAIAKLVKDENLKKNLSQNAKIKAETEFTLEKFIAETKKLY